MSQKITASKVLFIKLGRGGEWEKDCIEKEQTIRLGFKEADHNSCLSGLWDKIRESYFLHFSSKKNSTPLSTANRFVGEIRYFYEQPTTALWVTFYANKMWWCFTEPEVVQLEDKTKVRKVNGKWSDKDINGNELQAENLSGKLLRTQGYRGTICQVKEANYALSKINAEEMPEVTLSLSVLKELEKNIAALIKYLHWKDFETLIDLIFRQAGWQRMGQLGKTQKTLDLDILSPVTNERAIVQIKSSSDKNEFESCLRNFENMSGYKMLFYVVHTPEKSLLGLEERQNVKIMLLEEITKLAIHSGLMNWIIAKVS